MSVCARLFILLPPRRAPSLFLLLASIHIDFDCVFRRTKPQKPKLSVLSLFLLFPPVVFPHFALIYLFVNSAAHLCELITHFSVGTSDDGKLIKLLELVRERGHSRDADPSLYVAVINAFAKIKVNHRFYLVLVRKGVTHVSVGTVHSIKLLNETFARL